MVDIIGRKIYGWFDLAQLFYELGEPPAGWRQEVALRLVEPKDGEPYLEVVGLSDLLSSGTHVLWPEDVVIACPPGDTHNIPYYPERYSHLADVVYRIREVAEHYGEDEERVYCLFRAISHRRKWPETWEECVAVIFRDAYGNLCDEVAEEIFSDIWEEAVERSTASSRGKEAVS